MNVSDSSRFRARKECASLADSRSASARWPVRRARVNEHGTSRHSRISLATGRSNMPKAHREHLDWTPNWRRHCSARAMFMP
jgi:hypothetical protein